jgi:hypothetical protein
MGSLSLFLRNYSSLLSIGKSDSPFVPDPSKRFLRLLTIYSLQLATILGFIEELGANVTLFLQDYLF